MSFNFVSQGKLKYYLDLYMPEGIHIFVANVRCKVSIMILLILEHHFYKGGDCLNMI